MARGGLATLVPALLVGVLLAGCRAGDPSPSPSPTPAPAATTPAPTVTSGLRLAVVLPPMSTNAPGELAALRTALERFGERHDDDLASLRVVQPDTPAFTGDVATLVAERGADLVCVLGAGAGPVVLEVAAAFPATEFCATPAAAEPAEIPDNVLLVDVRVEELAYLAGVAAQLAGQPAVPGFVGSESQFAVDRRRAAFVAGINAVVTEPVTPFVGFPAGDETRAAELAAAQYEAGVGVIHTAAGPGDLGVLRAAEDAGRLVIGSRHTLVEGDETASPAVLMTADIDVTVPLEVALRRALGTWEGGRATVGLAEDAVVIAAGGSPRYVEVAPAVEAVRVRIAAGELRPLAPR